jgi:phosphatidylserine decarboxylase
MSDLDPAPADPVFGERPTEFVVRDAFTLGMAPLALAGAFGLMGWTWPGFILLGVTVFVACFFRNPPREIPGDEATVVSPADGRIIEVGEIELEDGSKVLRIAVFLSVFNVHVNRSPLAGRVVAIERGGAKFLAAFNRKAEALNVRCAMTLETAQGVRFQVIQITGLIARRIVTHPQVGDWVGRGTRYGLIRFGSRTDVILPLGSTPLVKVRDRVRGGSSILAELAPAGSVQAVRAGDEK